MGRNKPRKLGILEKNVVKLECVSNLATKKLRMTVRRVVVFVIRVRGKPLNKLNF